jgi:hypothetical protein
MNYREIAVDNPDYLHMYCHGCWDVETSKALWQQIAAALAQSNHGRVLIDEREVELETSVSIDFKHASFVAALLSGICRKVAIIDAPENSESSNFFETVCANRSLKLKFFLREEEAIDWLMAEAQPS